MNKVLTLSMRLLGSFGLDETKRSMNGLWPMRRRRISRSMELSVWDAALDDMHDTNNFLLLSIESMSLASSGRPSSSSLIKIFLFLYFI